MMKRMTEYLPVKLPLDVKERLEAMADRKGSRPSALARTLIVEGLDAWEANERASGNGTAPAPIDADLPFSELPDTDAA